MARVTTAKLEKFYEALAYKRVPFVKGRLHVKLSSRSSYIYQARKNGVGVKLKVNFLPGSNGWEWKFDRALGATLQLMSGRTSAVEIRLNIKYDWPAYITEPYARLEDDLRKVKQGYYLPKETQQWRRLLTP